MNTRSMLRGLIVIFMIRLVFAFLPSFQVDMIAWLAWANRLAELGPANFYSDTVWTQYTPGFLYYLWGVGLSGWVEPLAIKLPTILADMLTGYLIYLVVHKNNKAIGLLMIGLYALNPVAIFNGSIWGQVDGILTLAMFGAAYLLIEKSQLTSSFAMLAVAFLIKLQAMAIFPVMALLSIVKFGWKKTVGASLVAIMITILGYAPFYPANPVRGMLGLAQMMGESYPFTSLFAFNTWEMVGMWIADNTKWMGQTYFFWGAVMSLSALLLLMVSKRKEFNDRATMYLLLTLSCFIFFLFPTRVHERYLFPMFAFLLAYVGIKKDKVLTGITLISMVTYSLNLYLPYSHYEEIYNPLKSIYLESLINRAIPLLTLINLGIFFYLWLSPSWKNFKESVPVLGRQRKAEKHG